MQSWKSSKFNFPFLFKYLFWHTNNSSRIKKEVDGSRMRLNCPECAARYDVPEKNIPRSGRDVQCSACGHTWLQNHLSLSNLQGPVQDVSVLSQETDAVPEGSGFGHIDQPHDTSGSSLSRLDPTVVEVLKEEAQREVAVAVVALTDAFVRQVS